MDHSGVESQGHPVVTLTGAAEQATAFWTHNGWLGGHGGWECYHGNTAVAIVVTI